MRPVDRAQIHRLKQLSWIVGKDKKKSGFSIISYGVTKARMETQVNKLNFGVSQVGVAKT